MEIFIRPLEHNKMETHPTCNLDPLSHERVEMDPELITPPVMAFSHPFTEGIVPIQIPVADQSFNGVVLKALDNGHGMLSNN